MEGQLVEIDGTVGEGKVDTRNDALGVLKIYGLPQNVQLNSTIEFEVRTSRIGRNYAKFNAIVERNQALFNTEDRDRWYEFGENEEQDFIEHIVPVIGRDIRINPEKEERPWEIDLYDYSLGKYADLKTQKTPFFTASKYDYKGSAYNPTYVVTFNRKDYENYRRSHPNCDIYFWVNWNQLEYRNIRVQPLCGVWKAEFAKMVELIENGTVALHPYMHRTNDDHNARDSFLFDLSDVDVFERIV